MLQAGRLPPVWIHLQPQFGGNLRHAVSTVMRKCLPPDCRSCRIFGWLELRDFDRREPKAGGRCGDCHRGLNSDEMSCAVPLNPRELSLHDLTNATAVSGIAAFVLMEVRIFQEG